MANRKREDTIKPTELPRVREACKAAGMTLSELAAAADYSIPQLSRIVNGREPITADFRRRIATALGVSQADLFQGKLFAKI